MSPLEKARSYAFLLLKDRLRSEQEIRQRLEKKKYERRVIDQLLEFLKEKKFVDDRLFAKAWIDSRLKKPLGLRRLRQELKLKGIAREIIEEQLRMATPDYSESRVVAELARQKLAKLNSLEPEKARQRIYGYLLRRGFAMDIVIDTLKHLVKLREKDES